MLHCWSSDVSIPKTRGVIPVLACVSLISTCGVGLILQIPFATTTLANGFLAIIAGVVANVLADNLGHGPRVMSFS